MRDAAQGPPHSKPNDRGWGSSGLNAVVWLQGSKPRQVCGAATAGIAR